MMTWRDILAAAGPAGAAGLLCYAALQQTEHPGVQTLLFILTGVFAGAFIVQTTLLIAMSRTFP